jgi:alkylation response protein AidB-like acyl-CoA dehydrogenase
MSAPVIRGPLRHVLLGTPIRPQAGTARDVALLREGGYLRLAVPAHLGGEGLNLRQVACAQRQLAARAPGAALAVTAHHARVGAAADTLASTPGDAAGPGMERLLSEAAQGRFFAGCGPDELTSLPCDRRGDTFAAGILGWGLPLAGMTFYAIARQAFDLAVQRAHRAREAREARGVRGVCGARGADRADAAEGHTPGHPLDQWPVAEAALRLDSIRGQLDEVIAGWQPRITAGGALTSLDPGGQWLIRLFTVRHAAADGARRVTELAAQIAGQNTEPVGPVGPVEPVPGRAG